MSNRFRLLLTFLSDVFLIIVLNITSLKVIQFGNVFWSFCNIAVTQLKYGYKHSTTIPIDVLPMSHRCDVLNRESLMTAITHTHTLNLVQLNLRARPI
jgi:hypothetical protein